jgi:hypothetical protein
MNDFFTPEVVESLIPAFAEIARIFGISVNDPTMIVLVATSVCVKGARPTGRDFKFVIESRTGRLEWALRDPANGDRYCVGGSFRDDGSALTDAPENVLKLGKT